MQGPGVVAVIIAVALLGLIGVGAYMGFYDGAGDLVAAGFVPIVGLVATGVRWWSASLFVLALYWPTYFAFGNLLGFGMPFPGGYFVPEFLIFATVIGQSLGVVAVMLIVRALALGLRRLVGADAARAGQYGPDSRWREYRHRR